MISGKGISLDVNGRQVEKRKTWPTEKILAQNKEKNICEQNTEYRFKRFSI